MGGGTREICFHAMGEPLICKDLAKFIKLAKDLGYEYTYLDTNGILADEQTITAILDAGLDSLKFSIHAASKETYLLVNGTDNFDKVYSNFVYTSNYIRENGLACKLIAYMCESKLNVKEHNQFYLAFKDYADEIWIAPVHGASGVMVNENREISVEGKLEKNICSNDPFERLVVTWDGKAIGCCTDWEEGLAYANLETQSLKECWNNDKIIKLRKELYNVVNNIELTDSDILSMNSTCRKCLFG